MRKNHRIRRLKKMEAFQYKIEDSDHSYRVTLGNFGLVEIFYEHERCSTPVTKEKAEEIANTVKAMIESQYPIDSLNAEDYEPSDFAKMMEEMMEDDEVPSFLKMMALASAMRE